MTLKLIDGTIALSGVCPAEDAPRLLEHLLAFPGAEVDWRLCDEAHLAIVQILLASKAPLRGPPNGVFLRDFVAPLVAQDWHGARL